MDSLKRSKPVIGVSACLMGESVRYDGGHKRDSWVVEHLAKQVECVSFCPEVRMGLGVPRPTLHLEWQGKQGEKGPAELIETQSGRNLTRLANEQALEIAEELALRGCVAFVLKSRSPSCGVSVGGILAQEIKKSFPGALFVEEPGLQDASDRKRFLDAVFALHKFRMCSSIEDLEKFHAEHEGFGALGEILHEAALSVSEKRVRYGLGLASLLQAAWEREAAS